MCDKELIVGYLYGELSASEREAFDRHLSECAECEAEVGGLRTTRTQLSSWAPPEPDLGFEIVRGPRAVKQPPARWWHVSSPWGLAAAAMVMLAVSAGIANLEIQVGNGGFVVRTGWNRSAPGVPREMEQLQARLQKLELQTATVKSITTAALTPNPTTLTSPTLNDAKLAEATRLSDAEVLRLVRRLIAESEERQQGVLARQILQVNRDVQTARQADYEQLVYGMQRLQGSTAENAQQQKMMWDHLVRVGMQQR